MSVVDPDAMFDGASAELRTLLNGIDWSSTPLGPTTSWSPVLRLMVQMALRSGFSTEIHWGHDLVTIYNDAHVPLRGNRHPDGLGRATREVWPESWERAGPRFEQVLNGATLRFDDERQIIYRNGYPEECYFTFSQSPIVEVDGSVAGVITVATETTGQVLSERRMRVVRELGGLSATELGGVAETCRAALDVLATVRESIPFAMAFLTDRDGGAGGDGANTQVAAYGLAPGVGEEALRAPAGVTEAVQRAIRSRRPEVVPDLRARSAATLAPGPLGPLLPDVAVVLPLPENAHTFPVGAVVLGVNPYRPLDEAYRSFFDLIGRQFRVAVTDAEAREAERRRLRALADLDRTKTEFFQNVSHELRTPLTLLLAPLQDLMAATRDGRTDITDLRDDLSAALRAAKRLRVMVDALLDQSMNKSGFLAAKQRPIDLVATTADAAAMFRATAEHAGLTFDVDLPAKPVVAVADDSMWSTVVTNLLSNAVKYTDRGGVSVVLTATPTEAVLTVTDTGQGIAQEEQDRVFERFYRADQRRVPTRGSGFVVGPGGSSVAEPRSSAAQGSSAGPAPTAPAGSTVGAGIGLALVLDLVTLHRGLVDLSSAPGQGTTVSVTVPLEVSAAPQAAAAAADAAAGIRPTVLVVEDDPDLRHYLTRLLTRDGWAVTAVNDAEAAGRTALAPSTTPDLVLTDVMLPGDSGLQLVARLRQEPGTARLPIIVVTGRGGADAAGEGLAAGADDYVTKPFSSRELLARVRANHELHLLRERAVEVAQTRADQIRGALESNRLVGTAIGVVMATYQLTAQQAFRLLTMASQNTNSKLRDIAAVVVDSGALPYRPTVVDALLERVGREAVGRD